MLWQQSLGKLPPFYTDQPERPLAAWSLIYTGTRNPFRTCGLHAGTALRPFDQSCERIARMQVATAGEKRRPDIETSEIRRVTSGPVTGCVRTPGIVGENSGR